MTLDFIRDRALLRATGGTSDEREQAEILEEFARDWQDSTKGFMEIEAALALSALPPPLEGPSPALKGRVLDALPSRAQRRQPDGFVMASPSGVVEWVNSSFTELCGYSLAEVKGRRLGPILQGAETDPAAAEELRRAVGEHRACRVRLLNYHKNGSSYWVEISLTPITDDSGATMALAARERALT